MSNALYLQFANGEVFHNERRFSHPGAKSITKAEYTRAYNLNRLDHLRQLFKPGQRVATVLAHVSASGMTRSIKVLAINERGEITDVSWVVSEVVGRKFDRKRGGVVCHGCGMDMGFDLIYSLGRTLWPEGTDKPHSQRNGEPDNSGGYALSQYWV